MNQIYYKPNTPKLRKEIYEFIAYKPENIEKLLTDWFELDPMPMDFFKAFWLSTFNQGISQFDIINRLKEKAISLEKLDLIKTFLTMQIVKWQEMYQASIDRGNLNVVKFLVEDENFIYNPKDIDAICVYSYRNQDVNFVKEVNQLLIKNHIKIENYSYINHSTVEHLMNAIMQSGQIEYLELAQNNLNFKFDNNNMIPPTTSLRQSLIRNEFYTFSIKDQYHFLEFFMKYKTHVNDILIDYIKENNKAQNLPIMAEVIHQLITNKVIHLSTLYSEIVQDKHNFYGFYKVYHEKKQLDENLTAQERPTNPKKIKI